MNDVYKINKNMKKTFPAFTLVELIVVITIIGILSTVWFVSYSNYLTWARDSNRYSQLTKLSDSLQVYATTKSLPLPDDYIEITASWASNVIAYQGYVGTDVLETIDYTNWGKDPKDNSFYTYYLTKNRKSLQLMALMEEAGSVAQNTISNTTFAADYSSRFPKVYGRKLWVLTEVDTNTPVQELNIFFQKWFFDIFNDSWIYNIHIDNDKIISWGTNEIWSFLLLSSKSKDIDIYKQDNNLVAYFDFDISKDNLANSNIAINKIWNFNVIKDTSKWLVYDCDGTNRIVIGSGSTILWWLSEYTFYASYKLNKKQNNDSPKVVASYWATWWYNLFCQNDTTDPENPNIWCYVRINEWWTIVWVGWNSPVKYPRFEDILITQKNQQVLTAYNRKNIGVQTSSWVMNFDSGQWIWICARPGGGYNMTWLIDKIYISKLWLKTQTEVEAFYTLMNQ